MTQRKFEEQFKQEEQRRADANKFTEEWRRGYRIGLEVAIEIIRNEIRFFDERIAEKEDYTPLNRLDQLRTRTD